TAAWFGRKASDGQRDGSPLEGDAGVKVLASGQFNVLAGIGTGIVRGVGVPSFRMFAALSWAPDYRDTDGDGIDNMHDKCPNEPEDKDGFQDEDGCPDP